MQLAVANRNRVIMREGERSIEKLCARVTFVWVFLRQLS